jgi:hypothetical protein
VAAIPPLLFSAGVAHLPLLTGAMPLRLSSATEHKICQRRRDKEGNIVAVGMDFGAVHCAHHAARSCACCRLMMAHTTQLSLAIPPGSMSLCCFS